MIEMPDLMPTASAYGIATGAHWKAKQAWKCEMAMFQSDEWLYVSALFILVRPCHPPSVGAFRNKCAFARSPCNQNKNIPFPLWCKVGFMINYATGRIRFWGHQRKSRKTTTRLHYIGCAMFHKILCMGTFFFCHCVILLCVHICLCHFLRSGEMAKWNGMPSTTKVFFCC